MTRSLRRAHPRAWRFAVLSALFFWAGAACGQILHTGSVFVHLSEAPENHARLGSTPMLDGRIFVADMVNARIFDPVDMKWSAPIPYQREHVMPAAATLPDGRVLVVGTNTPESAPAEVYDPATNAFTSVGALRHLRYGVTLMRLPNGEVLVLGGRAPVTSDLILETEIFNPITRQFRLGPRQHYGHAWGVTVRLGDGRILLAGGVGADSYVHKFAEVYVPSANQFQVVGSMVVPRHRHASVLLPNGNAMISGGMASYVFPYMDQVGYDTEIFNPVTNTFSMGPYMVMSRMTHALIPLTTGKVLVVGGEDGNLTFPSWTELFDPVSGTFTLTDAYLMAGRGYVVAEPLSGGRALLMGGENYYGYRLTTSEAYVPDVIVRAGFDL